MLKHVLPGLGTLRLKDITAADLNINRLGQPVTERRIVDGPHVYWTAFRPIGSRFMFQKPRSRIQQPQAKFLAG
jgi:hypothetical protein